MHILTLPLSIPFNVRLYVLKYFVRWSVGQATKEIDNLKQNFLGCYLR